MIVPQQLIHAIQSSDLTRLPFYGNAMSFSVMGITPAQLNAGYYIVLPSHMLKLTVLDIFFRVNSAQIGAVTDVRLSTDEATPVDIFTVLQANATSGVKLSPESANMSLGAGFAVALQQGAGILLKKTGSDATGAFTLDLILTISAK